MAKSIKELVAYAKKRAKEKHKYSRRKGMAWSTHNDCHWFTSHVYKDCGYDDVYKRITKKGKPAFYKKPWASSRLGKYLAAYNPSGLKQKQLKPGDIVCRPQKIGGYHSGIYVGDGKIAEAVPPHTRIGKLDKRWKYAFRAPEPKKPEPKKKEVKTVEHKAKYLVTLNDGQKIVHRSTQIKLYPATSVPFVCIKYSVYIMVMP